MTDTIDGVAFSTSKEENNKKKKTTKRTKEGNCML